MAPASVVSKTDGSSTLVDSELGYSPSSTASEESKHIRQPFTLYRTTFQVISSIKQSFAKLWKAIRSAAPIIAAAVVLNSAFVILAYYVCYSEIYFNSKVATDIRRNSHTDGALQAFLWLFALAAFVPNASIGCLIAYTGFAIGKGHRMPRCILYVWTLPWAGASLAFLTITFWIVPVILFPYHTSVFNHGCASKGWDLDVVLNSPGNYTFLSTAPVVGTASILSTRSGINYSAELIRHNDSQLRFDFTFTATEGALFSNITYDWENQTYTAWGPNSTTKAIGTFTTSPNLSFQSLNLSLLDNSIPFQRPSYHCWPAAATLVLRNSTSKYFNVLQSLTLDPKHNARMKVCGMAGSVDREFQISLGVVSVNHFYYSLCTANKTVQADDGGGGDVAGGGGFVDGGGFAGGDGFDGADDGGDEGGDEGGDSGGGGDGGER